ncbi:MAG: hypothetical protein C0514_05555 [Candidatus Puniceispirillum sp.]|nr:hypothetical protein [Candidatus Puniceispirillum sp.]
MHRKSLFLMGVLGCIFALPLLASSQNKDMGSDEIATKKPKTEAQQMMKEARRAAKMQEMSAAMGGSQSMQAMPEPQVAVEEKAPATDALAKKPKTEAQQMMKEARRAAKMQEMSAAMGGSQSPGGKTGIADVPTHQQKDATQTLGHMEK